MRLEDTDEIRSEQHYTEDIISGLKWLGLSWNEGPDIGGPFPPYTQMEKTDHYEQIAHKLISQGKAYFCYATPEELEALREEQKAAGDSHRYDNRGRQYTSEQVDKYRAEGRVPVVRFKVEEERIVSWHDAIKGEIQIHTNDIGGDMVIVKSSGIAVYNFAVVVDDIDMKMTHVIRGEDHIHNTAKQILIYEALGQTHPVFGHVPLMFDIERAKLSKRKHGESVHITKYREDGYMPEAIVNYLAQISWTPPDGKELFTLEEAVSTFELDRVSKSPAVFDTKRLEWFNSHYIRSLPLSTVTDRAIPYLQQEDLTQYSRAQLEQIVGVVRDGLTSLHEIKKSASFFFAKHIDVPQELADGLLKTENSRKILTKVFESLPAFDAQPKECKAKVEEIGKELAIKGKDLYWPIRAALCGTTSGPDLGSTLSILGPERIKSRIESLLQHC